jgi:hypothetical protein
MYDEVIDEFVEIGKMELGTEQHLKAIQAANSVVDRLNKAEEIKVEREKLEIEKAKLEVEEQKLDHDKRNSLIRNILTGGTFIIATGVTIWANYDSKKFEGAFTHTTEAGKGSERRLLSLMDKVKIF